MISSDDNGSKEQKAQVRRRKNMKALIVYGSLVVISLIYMSIF